MPRSLSVAALVLTLAVVPAAAALGATDPAVTDCTVHNGLTHHYSVAELRNALATMPAEIKEYTSCGDIIQQALDDELSGLHATRGTASSGGSFLPLPVILVLVVVLLGGAAYGGLLLRRRSGLGSAGGG